jgi:thioredoxin-dependent peroxiredoxin
MSLRIGDPAPDFRADSTQGTISFHEWLGDSWGVFFSHPKDFTPVCSTELGYLAKLKPEFDKRGAKVIALSVDPVENHQKWSKDIEDIQGARVNYPLIGDPSLAVSKLYEMLPSSAGETSDGRTAVDNQTVRNVYIIGPDKRVKLSVAYPMSTGRNLDEVLRVLDSLQLTAKYKVATPVQWQPGEDVIIATSVTNDEAKRIHPDGWKEPKPYLRIVPQPGTKRVRFRREGIATFEATTDKIFRYMSASDHHHKAFKSHKVVGVADNVVTVDVDVYNPDGSTTNMTVKHRLDVPNGVETTMIGGHFDGARFVHSYTPLGDRTQVDLEGDFPALPGMSEADELRMIDGFFTTVFEEDAATLRTWQSEAAA